MSTHDDTGTTPRTDGNGHPPELHGHEHTHDDALDHRHPHHHPTEGAAGHEHAHTLGFERYTYNITPIHDLDPRFKVVSGGLLVLAVVAGPPPRLLEFGAVLLVLLTLTAVARIPLGWMLARTAVVLPVAAGIALFAPLGHTDSLSIGAIGAAYSEYSWLIWSIVSKAWISAFTVILISTTTPIPRLFKGLKALKLPDVFLTMLTFLYRFSDVFVAQLRSMRRAVTSRAPGLRGMALYRLYGNLAGNLFIRSYERGERVYAAMLSRGFNGVLPTADVLRARPADWLLLATAGLIAASLALY